MSAPQIRPVEDEAGTRLSLELWNAVYPPMAASLAGVLGYQRSCLGHFDLVAFLGDRPAGSGFAAIEPRQASGDVVKAMIAVLPAERRQGTGTALYLAVSAWAREQGRRTLETFVLESDPDGLDYATKRGFVEVGREQMVALDLAGVEEPRVEPPAGVVIVALAERPEVTPGMYEVAREAYPDIPGSEDDEMEPYEGWLAHDLRGPGDRPEATFVALAGDDVVGYAKFHLSDARPAVAVHDITAVRRAWRRRGIARALKSAEIAWAMQRGYERLETANELRNTPIRRLNERFGYRPMPGRALLRGPLAG